MLEVRIGAYSFYPGPSPERIKGIINYQDQEELSVIRNIIRYQENYIIRDGRWYGITGQTVSRELCFTKTHRMVGFQG